jgi:hypothetical protein
MGFKAFHSAQATIAGKFRNVFYFVSTYAFWGLPAFAFALHGWQGMSRTYQRMFDDGAIF